jgi:hypothetical protein
MDDAGEDEDTRRPNNSSPEQGVLPPPSTYGGPARWASRSLNGNTRYGEIVISVENLPGRYSHSHFGGVDGNIMHVRVGDIKIPNLPGSALAISELQSDLFSAGQRQGFYRDAAERAKQVAEADAKKNRLSALVDKLNARIDSESGSAVKHAMLKSPALVQKMRGLFDKSDISNRQINMAIEQEGKYGNARAGEVSLIIRDVADAVETLRAKDANDPDYDKSVADDQIKSLDEQIGRRVLERVLHNLTGDSRHLAWYKLLDEDKQEVGAEVRKTLARDTKRLIALKQKASDATEKLLRRDSSNPLPMHPWGKSWFEFGIKRMLKWAAERDYKYLVIPTAPVMSKIEMWGINPTDMNAAMEMPKERYDEIIDENGRQINYPDSDPKKPTQREAEVAGYRKMVYAIGKRANVEAPRVLRELGKGFGVQPVMIDQGTGKPVRSVKGKVTSSYADPMGPGTPARTPSLDQLVDVEINGEKGKMRYKDLVDGDPKFDTGEDGSTIIENEVDVVDAGHLHDVGSGDTHSSVPFFALKKHYGNGLWALPITPEIVEGYKKPLPGYARGGLVRASTHR